MANCELTESEVVRDENSPTLCRQVQDEPIWLAGADFFCIEHIQPRASQLGYDVAGNAFIRKIEGHVTYSAAEMLSCAR